MCQRRAVEAVDPEADHARGKVLAINPPGCVGVFKNQVGGLKAEIGDPEGDRRARNGDVDDDRPIDGEAQISPREGRALEGQEPGKNLGAAGRECRQFAFGVRALSLRPIARIVASVGGNWLVGQSARLTKDASAIKISLNRPGRLVTSMTRGPESETAFGIAVEGHLRWRDESVQYHQFDSTGERPLARLFTRLAASVARAKSEYFATGAECVSSE